METNLEVIPVVVFSDSCLGGLLGCSRLGQFSHDSPKNRERCWIGSISRLLPGLCLATWKSSFQFVPGS